MSTVTGSRKLDRILFAGFLGVMILASHRVLVYYHVTPTRVSVAAVAADGKRTALALPTSLKGVGRSIQNTEERICSFWKPPAARELTPPGGRLEWSVHYSIDSPRFDRVRILASEACGEN